MAPDLIFYAIIAAGLVLWLRNVLGTRHGDERQRHNPFTPEAQQAERAKTLPDGEVRTATPQDGILALVANPGRVTSVESKTAESGLLDIAKADKNFEINFFLQAAQDVFVMIVEAFARGEREILKDLLEPSVYSAFESAITAREEKGETASMEILAVRKAQVTAARVDGRQAYITVRFHADEISMTKNKDGEIIAGHAERIVPMRDLWTFGRDIRGRDPRWLVHETRGDIEGDNDAIPNTH